MHNDILCMVCGEGYCEPRLGMTKWEYELFRKGAGCPCCEGAEPPDKDKLEPSMEDLNALMYNGDEDPIDRLNIYETPVKDRPKWERPKDQVLWTCAGCGVEAIRNVDNGNLEYNVPHGSKAHSWYISHDFSDMEPDEKPAHVFKPDQPVCENCLQSCKSCENPVCSFLDYGDVYDDGWCSTLANYGCGVNDVFCIDCVESSCPDCGDLADECKCFECSECLTMCKEEDKAAEDAGMCQECYGELYKNNEDEEEDND